MKHRVFWSAAAIFAAWTLPAAAQFSGDTVKKIVGVLSEAVEARGASIDDYTGPDRTLTSTLTGRREPLNGGRLTWYTFKYPLLSLRIVTLIHWHALRLWLKQVPWFAKAARPADQRGLYRPHHSLSPNHPVVPSESA